MKTLRIHDILPDRILITRESARLLHDSLLTAVAEAAGGTVVIDFQGVEGVTPSFVDELLTVFELVLHTCNDSVHPQMVVANPPTRLSSKFEAVARGHGMAFVPGDDGSWILAPAA